MDTTEKAMLSDSKRRPQGSCIFALDVGTRSVIGVVGERRGDMLHVLAIAQLEHTKRAMIDGQIEDVAQVAKVAGKVKEQLEEELQMDLTHVCVAAAGRSLKTQAATYETELNSSQAITRGQVTEWEAAGVEAAHKLLFEQADSLREFSCVGYSVVNSYLDDYKISTLTDHRGSRVKIEMIATFLPTEVIESLYEVTNRIGLTVSSLTLEPIAAMNAIIPQELRLLNLALVDIGAGTSDIAISNNGSVTAYTMVTLAGDEISEALVQKYLVDFNTAEGIKHRLSENTEKIAFQDILGFSYEYTPEEIFDSIEGYALHLCEEIANAITRINGKAPAAVFLVGGGSRLVKMADMIAKKLELSSQKVAVGGSNYMKKMLESSADLTAAEYATPMGIAITAMNLMENSSITVSVNSKPVTLFKSTAITAMDALLMSGLKQNQLIGRSGQSVTFTMNSERIVVRGGHCVPAQITVNSKPASLTTPVADGDELDVIPAVTGEPAAPRLSDYIDSFDTFSVYLNGMERFAGRSVYHNGEQVTKDMVIDNLDEISVQEILTVQQLCELEGLDVKLFRFLVNGQEKSSDTRMSPMDRVEAVPTHIFVSPVPSVIIDDKPAKDISAYTTNYAVGHEEVDGTFTEKADNVVKEEQMDMAQSTAANIGNAEDTSQTRQEPIFQMTISPGTQHEVEAVKAHETVKQETKKAPAPVASVMRITLNGRRVALPPKDDGAPYQYFDMLNFVDIDPSKPQGNIVLLHNGKQAEYLAVVQPEDEVEIYWDSSAM